MIKITKNISVATVLVLTICLLVGSVIAFAADNKVYTIRFAHGLPATHHMAINFYNKWAKMINEESDGRLKVEVYPGGQLYPDTKLISAVKTGACEMGRVYVFTLGTIIPEFEAFTIPGVNITRDKLTKIVEGNIGKKLFNKIENKGLKPLLWLLWGLDGETQCLLSTTPAHVPLDLQGKKIRTMSPQQAQYFQEYCGASSAYVPGAELYMALQRGTLNATIGALSHIVDRKLFEVSPYATMIPTSSYPEIFIMNKEFYDKLPVDLQQVIKNVSDKIQKESYNLDSYAQILKLKSKALLEDRGEIYIPTTEEMALWFKDIEGFWKRVTEKNPEVYDLIMEIQNL